MACKDCFTGCSGAPLSDQCVKYTGDNIPLLGICTGDPLSLVEEIIIEKLISALNGTGIVLSTLTIGCPFISTLLGSQDKTLVNLIQVLINANCSLKAMVDQLASQVDPVYVFNTSCLTLPSNPTKDDILQATITKLCAVDVRVTNIEGDYVKASDINTIIQNYLNSVTNTNYNTYLIPKVAYPYFGSLSNFDNTGAGLSATGFTKVYLCNGANGTPDLRGRALVGAINSVPGGALDAAVDPTIPANAGTNYSLNDKFGESFNTLAVPQIPSHTHTVTDPGHIHYEFSTPDGPALTSSNTPAKSHSTGGNLGYDIVGSTNNAGIGKTSSSTTGISISGAGNSQPHNNRQPSIACFYIMYIP